MASLQTLNLEALLGPILGERPAGQDLLYEGTYETIRKARQEGKGRDALEPNFRHTEPHSPLAYLIECAIRWGEMPLQ
jgi:hypothetical protein